jgi:hypothetical protein
MTIDQVVAATTHVMVVVEEEEEEVSLVDKWFPTITQSPVCFVSVGLEFETSSVLTAETLLTRSALR